MVVATPKPRLGEITISPQGEEPFSLPPLIGKAPPEIHIWIIGGRAPAFVREEGPLCQGGPVWTIQLTSPAWPVDDAKNRNSGSDSQRQGEDRSQSKSRILDQLPEGVTNV